MNEAKNPVRAVETTLSILESVKELEGGTLGEIAENIGMTKGTVHNHLSTLEEHGFVVREDDEFRLGIRFFEFGEATRQRRKICEIGTPEVDKLAEQTGELGSLLIEEHGYGVYLYREQGENALSLDTGIGARVHLHNTALGKAILSQMSEDRVTKIIEKHGLPPTTENTIVDEDELLEDLERIREQGYALDKEERAVGVRCVAAPIVTHDGIVRGAVSVAGPTSRIRGERFHEQIPEMVQSAADVIGINLTYA